MKLTMAWMLILALISLTGSTSGLAQQQENSATFLFDNRLETTEQWAATLCDLDGDGHQELILALPGHDRERGRVIVLFGPTPLWPNQINLADLPAGLAGEFVGEWPGDRLGHAVQVVIDGYDQDRPQANLLIGAPGARNPDGLGGSGSVYVIRQLDSQTELSLDWLDGNSGYRLLASEHQDGLGGDFIFLAAESELPIALPASPWASLLQELGSAHRPAYWLGDSQSSPVQPIGRLNDLAGGQHRRFHADGREYRVLAPAAGRAATIMQAEAPPGITGLALEFRPFGAIGTGPEINFGDGIADQFVLAGEQMTVTFAVSDSNDPPESLDITVDFDTSANLFNPASVALTGTGVLRTLVAQTVSGFPDGSENFSVIVTNLQGQSASAPFRLFVLNSSVPEINGGLGLADQTATPGELLEIPFTATDLLFDSDSLIYQSTSSNQTLLPDTALVLDGDGPDRLLTIQSVPGQEGQSNINLEVSNSLGESAIETFLLTIAGAEPLINNGNGIADTTIVAGSTVSLGFTVSDPNFAPADLTVTVQSDNPALIDNANLTLQGTNQNRALSIQTTLGQTGTAGITIEVANPDGLSSSASFLVTVVAATPPLINFGQGIPDQTVIAGGMIEINLTVSDVVDPPGNLLLTAESLNPELVANDALGLFGTGTSRILRISTEPERSGMTPIRLRLTNSAGLSTQANFNLEIITPGGPIINDGAPLPDRTLPPDQVTRIEFVVRNTDGQPADLELRVFSSDQDVLPDVALRLENNGPDWELEIDTSLGQPGTTLIVIEARQPGGGVSQSSFELTINPAFTELVLQGELIEQRIGNQHLTRLAIENTGEHTAFGLLVALEAFNGLAVTGSWSQASGCSANNGEVRCGDLAGAAWQCRDESQARVCRLDQLPADSSAALIVAVTTPPDGQLQVSVDAANAEPVSTSFSPGD